jgi:hypothetical protein
MVRPDPVRTELICTFSEQDCGFGLFTEENEGNEGKPGTATKERKDRKGEEDRSSK